MSSRNRLLLPFNGSPANYAAVDFGVWLAKSLRLSVSLLGIIEKSVLRDRVEQVLDSAGADLTASGLDVSKEVEAGRIPETLVRRAASGSYLTILGPYGRSPVLRLLRGRSFRRIIARIRTPVIYVPKNHSGMDSILICMGGLGYARSAENWGLQLARRFDAKVTILHVVGPITFDYPTARKVRENWDHIEETDTPLGDNLRAALQLAGQMGVTCDFHVRHGEVVHEIITEIHSHPYDLVVMGSSTSSDKLRHLFLPNVTAEIAESVDRPVLVAGPGQEWIFNNSM